MAKTGLVAPLLLALLSMMGSAAADEARFARSACSGRDMAALSAIERHGEARDVSSRSLYGAALTMQSARAACRAGRVDEALALYEVILALGAADVVSASAAE